MDGRVRGGDGVVESGGWDLQAALRGLPRATGILCGVHRMLVEESVMEETLRDELRVYRNMKLAAAMMVIMKRSYEWRACSAYIYCLYNSRRGLDVGGKAVLSVS